MEYTYGVDVSQFQGNIDFQQVKNAGKLFSFIRASEGVAFIDHKYSDNIGAARLFGVLGGLYHVGRPDLNNDPVAEASYFCDRVDAIGGLQAGEFLALDIETNYAPHNVVDWSKRWLDAVQGRLGVKPLVYSSQSVVEGHDWSPVIAGDYGLWLACWDDVATTVPELTWLVAMKQYTDQGAVAGISGNVDLDVFYGSLDQLKKYGKQVDVPVTPTPTPCPEVQQLVAEIDAVLAKYRA